MSDDIRESTKSGDGLEQALTAYIALTDGSISPASMAVAKASYRAGWRDHARTPATVAGGEQVERVERLREILLAGLLRLSGDTLTFDGDNREAAEALFAFLTADHDAFSPAVSIPASRSEALQRMVDLDQEIEAEHPGWMTGAASPEPPKANDPAAYPSVAIGAGEVDPSMANRPGHCSECGGKDRHAGDCSHLRALAPASAASAPERGDVVEALREALVTVKELALHAQTGTVRKQIVTAVQAALQAFDSGAKA
jgi:hypothetical protein